MSISLLELARLVDGKLTGDGNICITGAATIRDARPGQITLADNVKFAAKLAACEASAVVVATGFEPTGLPFITVDNVPAAFARIVGLFRPRREVRRIGVSPAAHVDPTVKLGADVDIHPNCVIGEDVEIGAGSTIHAGCSIMAGCRIGENVTLFPQVVLYEDTVVGDRCILHAGSVIGAYGFGYELVEGRHLLSSQLGYVEIGNDVEIGAASTIDRGTYGPTVIGEGTKIDNQVMIAHNCRIGRHNLLCSQVGIAGSSSTGDFVVMAGQAGVRDHVHVGDRAVLCAQAGVMNEVPAGAVFLGSPATHEYVQMPIFAIERKLPEMRQRLRDLERQMRELADKPKLQFRSDAA